MEIKKKNLLLFTKVSRFFVNFRENEWSVWENCVIQIWAKPINTEIKGIGLRHQKNRNRLKLVQRFFFKQKIKKKLQSRKMSEKYNIQKKVIDLLFLKLWRARQSKRNTSMDSLFRCRFISRIIRGICSVWDTIKRSIL